MGRAFKSILGKKFGKLTVSEYAFYDGKYHFWEGLCDCGNIVIRRADHFKSVKNSSCGCVPKHFIHGKTQSTIFRTWDAMIQRATNPNCPQYEYYGGRGIGVCDRWLTFSNFLKDMGDPPNNLLTIDRIDNSKNYVPNNCRWASRSQQAFNKRTGKNRKSKYRGVSLRNDGTIYVEIQVRNKRIRIGFFKNEIDAAKAYDKAILEHWGDEALNHLNFK